MFDIVRALCGSLFGVDLAYYPRREGTKARIESAEMVDSIRKALDKFSFESADSAKSVDAKLLMDRAKDSLEEARKQTEYQDGKAGRLLTIVAFLTAAVGTVFGKFIDLYPLHGAPSAGAISWWVTSTYLLFGIYLLLVAAGALVTFHAMSTRFVWPEGSNLADKDHVLSLLFFKEIIRTKPEAWGRAFADDNHELLRMYYKNYVAEAYLIAAKVADKLRYLEPGQRLLQWGIRVLLGLFIVIMLTCAFVPPTKAADKRESPEQGASNAGHLGAASGVKAGRAPDSVPKKPAQPASGE
jgi:hypothetical protein